MTVAKKTKDASAKRTGGLARAIRRIALLLFAAALVLGIGMARYGWKPMGVSWDRFTDKEVPRAAKRVRGETAIAERPVSIAAAALMVARNLHGDLTRCQGLLVDDGHIPIRLPRAGNAVPECPRNPPAGT